MKTAILKPGLLVSLKTSIRGGINYRRKDLEVEHQTEEGSAVARWETEREIVNPAEFDIAQKARSKARVAVASVCCTSSFGLLCPISDEQKLTDAIALAREVATEHNKKSTTMHLEVCVLVGRIASDDKEAANAIASEMRDLLADMQEGIKKADPAAIREAANKARAMDGMLSPEVSGKVSDAIEQARKAAREIVKRVEKDGEKAAEVVADLNINRIKTARFAFLDLDDSKKVTKEKPKARSVDFETAGA